MLLLLLVLIAAIILVNQIQNSSVGNLFSLPTKVLGGGLGIASSGIDAIF